MGIAGGNVQHISCQGRAAGKRSGAYLRCAGDARDQLQLGKSYGPLNSCLDV